MKNIKSLLQRKRPRFKPDLIDLEQYEKNLLYAREHNKKPPPVKPWPSRSDWTDSELQYMKDNREKAKAIRKRIFPNDSTR